MSTFRQPPKSRRIAVDDVHQEALAIFDGYKPRYSGAHQFHFDFSGPKVVKKSERPGTNFTTQIAASLEFGAGFGSGGLVADSYGFWQFMKAHPGQGGVLVQAFTEASKADWSRVEAHVRDHLLDKRFAGHVLDAVVGYRESGEWTDAKVLKVGNIDRSGKPRAHGPQTMYESVTVEVVLEARKLQPITKAPFDAMSDSELNKLIQEFENEAPENFWQDGELRMTRAQAYAMYRKRWRAMSPRDQTNMMRNLNDMASRVASRWLRSKS